MKTEQEQQRMRYKAARDAASLARAMAWRESREGQLYLAGQSFELSESSSIKEAMQHRSGNEGDL